MTYNNKTNYIALPHKTRFIVLTFGLVLFIVGTAGGQAQQDRNALSCKTLRVMARVYMAYGEYAKAQPLAEQALTLAKKRSVSDSELAMCLIDLATLYKYQYKLIEAGKLCELGLKLQEKILYKNHPYLAQTLRALASIYREQGEYDKAARALDKAIDVMHDSHTENDKALIPFWVDNAVLLTARGDFQEAESYYQKAMTLINGSYGPDHLYTANVISGMARLYAKQGRYHEAEELIDRSIATQEKIYGPDHHLIAPSWLTKARLCQVKGDYVRSEKLIEKALDSVRKTGNTGIFTKLEQRAKEIRAGKQKVSGPVAKSVENKVNNLKID